MADPGLPKGHIEKVKQMIYDLFDTDTSNYPKSISWNNGNAIPDLVTYSTATISSNKLTVSHLGALNFRVSRILTADVHTSAAQNPQSAERGCEAKEMVQLTVDINVDKEKGKIKLDKKSKTLIADGNPCLNLTRGHSIVLNFFDAFDGFNIPLKDLVKEI